MAWHHIKLRSRRWPCIKICQAICTYQAAKHSQPPNTWPTTAWQPKVVNGLAPHQTQKLQMALHQDMPSHLHLPGRQTFTTSKYSSQYNITTKGCKWLGTTSNSEAADGRASRYAKPSAPTKPPNIYNLQTTWICLSKLKQFFLKQIGKNASNSPTTDIYLKTIHIISTE